MSCAETLPCFTKQLLPSRSNGAPLNLTRGSASAVAGGALQCSDYLLLSQWQLCPRGERRKCPYRGKGGRGGRLQVVDQTCLGPCKVIAVPSPCGKVTDRPPRFANCGKIPRCSPNAGWDVVKGMFFFGSFTGIALHQFRALSFFFFTRHNLE